MSLLFLHQNFPGQFSHLAGHLAQKLGPGRVIGLGDAKNLRPQRAVAGVQILGYRHPSRPAHGHLYLHSLENQVRRGQAVLRGLLQLKKKGIHPRLICVHPSWGEALFLREAFPDAKILCYSEFFYRTQGSDFEFDPEFPSGGLDAHCQLRLRNTVHLHALEIADQIWAPSRWQASQLPELYRERCEVIHEGIDTDQLRPDPTACFHAQGLSLTRQDSVVTYVARNLEPYRGFHIFMRALPAILAANPHTQVVIVGGDDVSYGSRPSKTANWRTEMLAEVGAHLDTRRVHFLGKLPYADYLRLLQVSTAHVYLTYPFVLSWSLLEAMAIGCTVVASRTGPVEEVIEEGRNGVLVDFFAVDDLARQVSSILADPEAFQEMRHGARDTVQERYDLHRVCLPRQMEMIEQLLG